MSMLDLYAMQHSHKLLFTVTTYKISCIVLFGAIL